MHNSGRYCASRTTRQQLLTYASFALDRSDVYYGEIERSDRFVKSTSRVDSSQLHI